jgi:enamine deaminase RidA (YjgF/YER057c/UK114 family)
MNDAKRTLHEAREGPGKGRKDDMKSIELMPITADKDSLGARLQLKNISLHSTEAGNAQTFLVASAAGEGDAATSAGAAYALIADALHRQRMEIVHERIFGSLSVAAAVMDARRDALGTLSAGPVTYIEGAPHWGEGYAGSIIQAVSSGSPGNVWTIMDGETPCGRGWRRKASTYFMLQNVQGAAGSRSGQVREMFDRAEGILRRNGASYKDVARTWLYLSDILDWYPEFNKARSEKYGEFGIMPGPGDARLLLPASTGIGADTPSAAAASMDLLAVLGREVDETAPVRKLSNREQLDAFRYGAAFSRGAVMMEDDVKLIQVSGTAAIDEHGISLHRGDIRSQINCTFDRIETLLGQEGAGLGDVAAATVFVKRPEYASIFRDMAKDRGLEIFPAVCVVADVCREELLFEIDAEAVVRR